MRSTVLCILIASLIGVCGATAAENSLGAATSRITTFQVSGITFAFPIPDGFCLPTGRYATQANLTANGDPANITDVSFDDCAAMATNGNLTRWGMVKTPRQYVSLDAGTREKFIQDLKAQFASGEFERSMNQGAAQAQPGIGTHVRPLGTDANGGYIGGTLTMNGPNRPMTLTGVWSLTVVKHRVTMVYLYGPYHSQKDVDALVALVRTATAKFIAVNQAP